MKDTHLGGYFNKQVMQTPLKSYVIEDEPLASDQLQTFINKHEDLLFIGHTYDIADQKSFIMEMSNADILFLDMQIGGGNIEEIQKELLSVPFIVITSTLHPSDYPSFIKEREHFILRKPTTFNVFEKCIHQIVERLRIKV